MKTKEIIVNEDVNLFEINMSPSSLRQLASNIDARAGMEFEMIVPGGALEDEDVYAESEPDYDTDELCESIDDIVRFFDSGDQNSSYAIRRLREKLEDRFEQYVYEQASDSEELLDRTLSHIQQELKSLDEDEIREILGLDSDAEISRDEILDAAQKVFEEQIGPFYENAYDDALQEMRGIYTEEQWLEEAGYSHMSDIASNFDIEWPHWTEPESSDNPMDIYSVGEEFENAIGRSVNVSDSYHHAPRTPGEYAIEPDGSLNPADPSNESGLEFISPPLPIGELLSDLNKVKEWAKGRGCYTNSSTGLHINVSIENKNFDQLDYVKLALLLGDLHVLEEFDRVGNRYTASAFEKVKEKARNPNFDVEPFLDQMREHLSAIGSKVIHSGITEKFISIHPKDGYIEFRSPGGDWLRENFSKIENTLLRFVVALDAALDPNKYRQEYLKKLYKLFRVQTPMDPMKYFAMYVAGRLPMQALKSFIRQIQLGRTKTQSNLTKQPMAPKSVNPTVPRSTSSNAFNNASVSANSSGPITGPDAWVLVVGDRAQGRVRGATQSDANEAARQWVLQRSREWLADHEGQELTVVPLSSYTGN